MAMATARDVETALMRDLTTVETRYVEELLGRAERMLTSRAPGLLERAVAEPSLADLIADVEAEMLARVFRADNNIFTSETEGNYSYRANLQVASGLLDVLDKEWERLGVGSWGSIAPETDGYLVGRRRGVRPDLQFQYAWPASSDISPFYYPAVRQ